MIQVLNNPIYAIVVTKGRYKHTHLGVKVGGPADEYAFHIANQLVANTPYTNMIELNFPHLKLLFSTTISIAITGAKCEASVNNESINMWQTIDMKAGDTLNIGKFITGLRVYIAFANGLDIPYKTQIVDDIKLKVKDIFKLRNPKIVTNKRLKKNLVPKYEDSLTLRVMLSYQHKEFDDTQIKRFFDSKWIVSQQINRMGYKLEGEALKQKKDGIISQGICFGAVQIPKDGQPIVLLKDRQTIGGYPIIGVVLDVDCFSLSQTVPSTKVKFRQISFKEATAISKKFYSHFL